MTVSVPMGREPKEPKHWQTGLRPARNDRRMTAVKAISRASANAEPTTAIGRRTRPSRRSPAVVPSRSGNTRATAGAQREGTPRSDAPSSAAAGLANLAAAAQAKTNASAITETTTTARCIQAPTVGGLRLLSVVRPLSTPLSAAVSSSPESTGATPTPPSGLKAWVIGARLRTLPAAVVPVVVGTAVAHAQRPVGASTNVSRAGLALVVSLALQVGVNYANDYSDGIRGTDDVRVGPLRLVGSKIKSAQAVKAAALGSLAVAAACGLVLAALTTWWLILVGLAAILAAWGYTGGPRPYGYAGLGEVFVFVFFGVVAVAGSSYVQRQEWSWAAVVAAVPVGMLATALLVTNNLRDIPGDSEVGKRTLAVRMGDQRTRQFYVALVGGAFFGVVALALVLRRPSVLIGLLAAFVAVAPVRTVRSGAKGKALISVLGATGKVQLAVGVLVSLGVLL